MSAAVTKAPARVRDCGLDRDYWDRWCAGELVVFAEPGRSLTSVIKQIEFCRDHIAQCNGPADVLVALNTAALNAQKAAAS